MLMTSSQERHHHQIAYVVHDDMKSSTPSAGTSKSIDMGYGYTPILPNVHGNIQARLLWCSVL